MILPASFEFMMVYDMRRVRKGAYIFLGRRRGK